MTGAKKERLNFFPPERGLSRSHFSVSPRALQKEEGKFPRRRNSKVGLWRRRDKKSLLLPFSLLDLYCEVHEEDDGEGCGGEEGERVDAREEEGRQGWDHVAHGVGQVRSVLLFNTRGCAVSKL